MAQLWNDKRKLVVASDLNKGQSARAFYLNKQSGFSLIELMISSVIGLLILLAVSRAYIATTKAYTLNEGSGRIQENARLALESIQRDVRMAGYMGCVNDGARLRSSEAFVHLTGASNTQSFTGTDFSENFSKSLEGFEAAGTGPGASINLASASSTWSPVLPTQLRGRVVAGSDVLVVRYIGPNRYSPTSITTVSAGKKIVLPASAQNFVVANRIYAISDCRQTSFFYATGVNSTGTEFTAQGVGGSEVFVSSTAYIYETTSVAYYVGQNGNIRSLYRLPLYRNMTNITATPLVDNVQTLQAVYAWDSANPLPDGAIDKEGTAASLASATVAGQQVYDRVGQVRVGLLLQAQGPRARDGVGTQADQQSLAGVQVRPADPKFLYESFETTAASRNHLFGY